MNREEIKRIIARYPEQSGRLLGVLEDIQNKEKYISTESMKNISELLDVPFTKVYSVATFYSFFNLKPVGTHMIKVCMGTACHVKGAPRVLETIENLLGIKPGEVTDDGKFLLTTSDRKFSVSVARCFGACSMAPVIMIDKKVYGFVDAKKLPKILKEYGWGDK